jgi:hypothetical protein
MNKKLGVIHSPVEGLLEQGGIKLSAVPGVPGSAHTFAKAQTLSGLTVLVGSNVGLGETYSLTFQGLNGIFPGAITSGGSGGCCFIAEQYSNGSAYDFSFTGFTYTINVTSVSTGSTSVYFSQFSLGAQVVEFGTAIPEPSTMMFCGLGFLALAWGVGRRRFRGSV